MILNVQEVVDEARDVCDLPAHHVDRHFWLEGSLPRRRSLKHAEDGREGIAQARGPASQETRFSAVGFRELLGLLLEVLFQPLALGDVLDGE